MKFSKEELSNRRPVWEALSTLFLDTDSALEREYRVQQLTVAPYTIDEIENILIHEVYPACGSNLFQIAGEWAGFDMEWLEKQIHRRMSLHPKWIQKFHLGRITIYFLREWQLTKKAVVKKRRKNRDT